MQSSEPRGVLPISYNAWTTNSDYFPEDKKKIIRTPRKKRSRIYFYYFYSSRSKEYSAGDWVSSFHTFYVYPVPVLWSAGHEKKGKRAQSSSRNLDTKWRSQWIKHEPEQLPRFGLREYGWWPLDALGMELDKICSSRSIELVQISFVMDPSPFIHLSLGRRYVTITNGWHDSSGLGFRFNLFMNDHRKGTSSLGAGSKRENMPDLCSVNLR